MENLKKLREAHGMTQKGIAEKLNTTQQTVARWESGKAEPGLAHLKDLAVMLRTSVDHLLGNSTFGGKPVVSLASVLLDTENVDGFWGHFGVLLPNNSRTLWYPISSSVSDDVSAKLQNADLPDNNLILVPTLNNRVLIFDPKVICQAELLHDNCDAPDDWDISWWDPEGMPLELYRGLDDFVFHERCLKNTEASDEFILRIENIVREYGLSDDAIRQRTCISSIHRIDGSVCQGEAAEDNLDEIFSYGDDVRELPTVLQFYSWELGFNHFIPSNQIALIDLPLIRVTDAMSREL